jgi:hypothetical protein
MVLALWAGPTSAETPEWVRYQQTIGPRALFSFEHPKTWLVKPVAGAGSTEFSSPDDSASLFLAIFARTGGSLDDFSVVKFSVQSELFKGLSPARDFSGSNWKGLLQEAQDKAGERRVIVCANSGDFYVSLSLYVTSKDFIARRAFYERLFKSVQFSR